MIKETAIQTSTPDAETGAAPRSNQPGTMTLRAPHIGGGQEQRSGNIDRAETDGFGENREQAGGNAQGEKFGGSGSADAAHGEPVFVR